MATIRTVTVEDLLEIEVEDIQLEGVHFTDEQFDATLAVRNLSDDTVTGEMKLQTDTETTIGLDRDPIRSIAFDVDIAAGDVHREPFGGVGMIGGAGMGTILSVLRPTIVDTDGNGTRIEPGENPLPLVNVVFWDRDFYRANFLWPRRAQYLAVIFALLSAVLAGTLVWLSIG